MTNSQGPQRFCLQGGVVLVVAAGFLLALAPSAPFTKELGVCESGATRDVLSGNVILPRFLPGPIVHVPPLYWWITALCVKALGWNELAFRLPSVIAAAMTCAIVFAWAGQRISLQAGLWSAAALLLCHFFLDAARQPRMDSMLALFVTAAVLSLDQVVSRPTQSQSSTNRYYVAAAVAIGLGTLTKGILGIVLPGLVVGLFLLLRGRLRELFRVDLIATFAAGLAPGLAWFIAGYYLGGRHFLDWQVRMNLWSRFIPAGAGGASYCAHPFWYFAPHILRGFLPWTLYLPALAFAAWPRAGRSLPDPIVYALCWFVALFIFFSSSQGKCLIYILPSFPPLAILTGWAIVEAQNIEGRSWVRSLFSAGSVGVAIGATIMVVAAIVAASYGLPAIMASRLHPTDQRFLQLLVRGGASPSLLLWAVLSLAGVGLIVAGVGQKISMLQPFGTLIIAAAGGWFWFAVMNPALAQRETLKKFAREVAEIVPASQRIGHFGLGDCELNFYSPRPLEPVSHLSCIADPAAEQYIIIRKEDFDAIPPIRRICFATEVGATPNDTIGPRLLIRRIRP
jgi:4-amino-4-deoxy-L-arabinose transferase-like glycosyltransferase